MGHIRLGDRLPRTRKWGAVVGLIGGGSAACQVAAATLDASQDGFSEAADDDGLTHVIWLLTRLPLAARSDDFVERLRQASLDIPDSPSLFDVVSAFSVAVDRFLAERGTRSDFGEMAQQAAAATLTTLVAQRTSSLFGATPDDVERAFRELSTRKQFGALARDFFARFTERYLGYFLSRELSNHVGGRERFASIDDHSDFNAALSLHCFEAAKIVEHFAGGWFSKTEWEGGITPEKARGFVHVALKKLKAEFDKRGVRS